MSQNIFEKSSYINPFKSEFQKLPVGLRVRCYFARETWTMVVTGVEVEIRRGKIFVAIGYDRVNVRDGEVRFTTDYMTSLDALLDTDDAILRYVID